MNYLQLTLFVVGVGLLVLGYCLNRRKMLASAAIMLFLAGTAADLARDVYAGDRGGWSAVSVQTPAP